MAHTKQTPRNPNLERPSAAMGSDVQERRVSLKPTSKKLATKGGKQPRKHMLHKLLKQTSTTGGIKKPHRYHLGLLALREIHRYQQSTESLIRRTPFNKLIKEISQEYRICPEGPRNPFCSGEVPVKCFSCSSRSCQKLFGGDCLKMLIY